MGIIRGVLLVFVCTMLFLSLFAGNIMLTLSSSLKYENAKTHLVSFLGDVVSEQMGIDAKMNQLLPSIELHCQTNAEYSFTYGNYALTIPCNVLERGSDAVVDYGIGSFVDKYYYAEYDCNFWDCFREGVIPFFLVSQKAQLYWQGKFFLSLLLSLFLIALLFLLSYRRINSFFIVGGLMLISALPLLWIGKISSGVTSLSGNMAQYASQIALIFFNQSRNVFAKIAIIAGILIAVGIILKIFHLGLKISNFFSKMSPSKKTGKIKSEKKLTDKTENKKNKKSK